MLDFSITFLITILNLTVLFLFLRKVLFKPVTKFMESRTQSIAGQIEQAKKDTEEAKRLKSVYDAQIANAAEEASKILKNAKSDAERQAELIIADAQKQRDTILLKTMTQIEAEKKAALLCLQAETAALVLSASGKLIRRQLSGQDVKHQAENFLKELGESEAFSHFSNREGN